LGFGKLALLEFIEQPRESRTRQRSCSFSQSPSLIYNSRDGFSDRGDVSVWPARSSRGVELLSPEIVHLRLGLREFVLDPSVDLGLEVLSGFLEGLRSADAGGEGGEGPGG
jgi:hypothetical protein